MITMMFIFGKKRESLRIKKSRACRALYVDGNGTEEIEVHLITEEGHRLDLQLPHRQVPALIGQLTDAYEAINVPLHYRRNGQAGWDGADNL